MTFKMVATHRLSIAGLDKPVSSGFKEKDRKQDGGVTEEAISTFHSCTRGQVHLHTCVHTCIY